MKEKMKVWFGIALGLILALVIILVGFFFLRNWWEERKQGALERAEIFHQEQAIESYEPAPEKDPDYLDKHASLRYEQEVEGDYQDGSKDPDAMIDILGPELFRQILNSPLRKAEMEVSVDTDINGEKLFFWVRTELEGEISAIDGRYITVGPFRLLIQSHVKIWRALPGRRLESGGVIPDSVERLGISDLKIGDTVQILIVACKEEMQARSILVLKSPS